ncbi:hypothetical protein HMI54_014188, partial [Coelomomyces lativittatus]
TGPYPKVQLVAIQALKSVPTEALESVIEKMAKWVARVDYSQSLELQALLTQTLKAKTAVKFQSS